jgi:hypothetical protein
VSIQTVQIVHPLWTIETDTDLDIPFGEQFAPTRIDQGAISLDTLSKRRTTRRVPQYLECRTIEIWRDSERFTRVPTNSQRPCIDFQLRQKCADRRYGAQIHTLPR